MSDHEPPVCANCEDVYDMGPGDEPTRYCHSCAHQIVETAEADRDQARAELRWCEAEMRISLHRIAMQRDAARAERDQARAGLWEALHWWESLTKQSDLYDRDIIARLRKMLP